MIAPNNRFSAFYPKPLTWHLHDDPIDEVPNFVPPRPCGAATASFFVLALGVAFMASLAVLVVTNAVMR